MQEDKRNQAICMLQIRAKEIGRLPRKRDFSSYQICFIKHNLGPWPRALEAAGLKPISRHRLEKMKNK